MQRTKTFAKNKRLCLLVVWWEHSSGPNRQRLLQQCSIVANVCPAYEVARVLFGRGEHTRSGAWQFFPVFRSRLRMLKAAVRRRPARQITPRKRGADPGLSWNARSRSWTSPYHRIHENIEEAAQITPLELVKEIVKEIVEVTAPWSLWSRSWTVPQNREEVVQCTPQDLVLNRTMHQRVDTTMQQVAMERRVGVLMPHIP